MNRNLIFAPPLPLSAVRNKVITLNRNGKWRKRNLSGCIGQAHSPGLYQKFMSCGFNGSADRWVHGDNGEKYGTYWNLSTDTSRKRLEKNGDKSNCSDAINPSNTQNVFRVNQSDEAGRDTKSTLFCNPLGRENNFYFPSVKPATEIFCSSKVNYRNLQKVTVYCKYSSILFLDWTMEFTDNFTLIYIH